jgi:hypothetical protein
VGSTVTLWSVGQALYLFNQFYLRSLDLSPNVLLFLFFISMFPLSIAVLHRSQGSRGPLWLQWFDVVQVAGIVLAACLLNFDLSKGKHGLHEIELRLMTLHVRNLLLAIALVLRAITSKGKDRQLFAPISFAFSFFTLSSWLGNQATEIWGVKTLSWCDLSWSLPFAVIAVAAAQWSHAPRSSTGTELIQTQSAVAGYLTEYLLPFCLSIFVIVLALIGVSIQRDIAASLILASLLCLFARTSAARCYSERLVRRLETVLEGTKRLTGYLPLCAACKMIRDDDGSWRQLESYIRQHSEAEFTHGICPDCAYRLYPDHATTAHS